MRLRDCLGLGRLLQGDPESSIDRVVYDSRLAGPGTMFVALPGFHQDGHLFIPDAIARGVSAVVLEQALDIPKQVAVLQVDSTRRSLGALAAQNRGWPTRKLRTIGVTGTNGKTTTTHLIRAILMEHGYAVGLIGTVHNFIGEAELPSQLTTPQASDVHDLFSHMVDAGCTHVVMEVSSEGLDLNRVDDVEFDVGVFTNLTQDHLNYHGTLENYRAAKLRLFQMLGQGHKPRKKAVLNVDDPSCDVFQAASKVPVLQYGLEGTAALSARKCRITSAGSRFILCTEQGEVPIHLNLAGRFNIYNALAAAGACLAEGVPLGTIKSALEKARGVTGRMEAIRVGQSYGVFVDYAHSPDGLENVLRTAQGFARGRVIAVFGCGGDRDRSKRPEMGRIAAEIADYTIITSDNPRTEDPELILSQIEAGLLQVLPGGEHYEIVVDREAAIARAIEIAQPDDVVLIAGKGHETYQIFKDRTIDFDDREVASRLIRTRLDAGKRKGGA